MADVDASVEENCTEKLFSDLKKQLQDNWIGEILFMTLHVFGNNVFSTAYVEQLGEICLQDSLILYENRQIDTSPPVHWMVYHTSKHKKSFVVTTIPSNDVDQLKSYSEAVIYGKNGRLKIKSPFQVGCISIQQLHFSPFTPQ